ncbi:uncharacterized protein LOC110452170 [Mizuhopecten yessoensis]|uniref:Uncharacterized protein n=1 Tax=Mizuhopecten yessoensis TaxID=6573 RepID=A0A210QK84_MIZYE|nr:uncharacterized protein LOC110452170 [Mizuhopecten yessoensis]OWF49165.1 hypothetical protein KP79_PYT23956 [Mizuhopecten yessoensis]
MRGRGRGGRGRGGRGRRGGRSGSHSASAPTEGTSSDSQVEVKELSVDTDLQAFFVGNASVAQHYAAQNQNTQRYAAGMAVLQKNGVEIVQNARIRALAAAWARKDFDLSNAFLKDRDNFGLVEVLKALQLIDSGRQIRAKEKQLRILQISTNKVSPKTMGKLKSDIDNLNALKPPFGTASGAVCKHIRRWVQTFTTEELEFYSLYFPKQPWQKLADLCHFNPEKDFPALTWFLPYCFGKDAPEGSMTYRCQHLTTENINEVIKEFPIPYSLAKQHKDGFTPESKARIAAYEPKLDTILWYYEDIGQNCSDVDKIIADRMKAGEEVKLQLGKLMDRLLMLKMYRENIPSKLYYGQKLERSVDENKAPFIQQLAVYGNKRLKEISLSLEAPIVVSGDASGSMEIAIRTSVIISGILAAICSAKLIFFNNDFRYPSSVPTNIEEVLELAIETKAGGGTSPAASLWPYYEKKEVIKTFIMVTDEEENSGYKNHRFAELYQKYYDEVYPMRLVFVSFLRDQHAEGQMVRELKSKGHNPLQVKFHQTQPDLTKLDKMFGTLSSESLTFEEEVTAMESSIRDQGLANVFQKVDLSSQSK